MLIETDLGYLRTGQRHVVRVGPNLALGEQVDLTGRHLFQLPFGGEVENPYMVPRDGRDAISTGLGQLVSRLGSRRAMVFPFLEPSDLDQIDLIGRVGFDRTEYVSRCMVGLYRASIFAEKSGHPGLLVTKPIDLERTRSGCEGRGGSIRIYWQTLRIDRTEDRYDPPTQPQSSRQIGMEVGAESGFRCLVATDGQGFREVSMLEPTPPCGALRSVRVGFLNQSPHRVYLVCFAILY